MSGKRAREVRFCKAYHEWYSEQTSLVMREIAAECGEQFVRWRRWWHQTHWSAL